LSVGLLAETATHCNTLQHVATRCNTLQHTATHCNTPQHTATHRNTLQHTVTHCSTLQHTAAHCNTPQHTATHCNTLHNSAESPIQGGLIECRFPCNVLECNAVCCSMLQCVAVCCCVLLCFAVRCSVCKELYILSYREHTARHRHMPQHTATYSVPFYQMSGVWLVADCCSVLHCSRTQGVAGCCRALQGVARCCRVLPCVAGCCRVLPCVAGCCSVLQFVAVCCRLLQCVQYIWITMEYRALCSRILKRALALAVKYLAHLLECSLFNRTKGSLDNRAAELGFAESGKYFQKIEHRALCNSILCSFESHAGLFG